MKKGVLVKLNPNACFTTDNGGSRSYPLGTSEQDDQKIVESYRHLTDEERENWEKSSDSKGVNSAGESKLPPTCAFVPIHVSDVLIVERARCRKSFGYYSATGGWAKVLNTKTGLSSYIKRELLETLS